jgi:flagellar motor switch protein FliM
MDRGLHVLLLTTLAVAAALPGTALAQAAGESSALPSQQPQVVEPAVRRRDVEPAGIDTENFEAGAFVGTISIEDYGTSLLYGAVDRILGGSGKVTKVPKDFTQAEHTVAEALVAPCIDRICESLADVVQLKWSFLNRFCNPSMAQILPSQDVVVSIYFQAAGDFLIGDLRLVIPFVSLEPLLERFTRDTVSRLEPGAMKEKLGVTVRDMPLDLTVELGGANIRLGQLMSLQPGDVIPLNTRIGEAATVPVMGKPKFTAHIGRIGNRLGIQVADVMGE